MNGWTHAREALVSNWKRKASLKQFLHESEAIRYNRYSLYLNVPMLILSTLTTSSLFTSADINYYIIGTASLLVTTLGAIGQLVSFGKTSNHHLHSSREYSSIEIEIVEMLSRDPVDRTDSSTFISDLKSRMNNLNMLAPLISQSTVKKYASDIKEQMNELVQRPPHDEQAIDILSDENRRHNMIMGLPRSVQKKDVELSDMGLSVVENVLDNN